MLVKVQRQHEKIGAASLLGSRGIPETDFFAAAPPFANFLLTTPHDIRLTHSQLYSTAGLLQFSKQGAIHKTR